MRPVCDGPFCDVEIGADAVLVDVPDVPSMTFCSIKCLVIALQRQSVPWTRTWQSAWWEPGVHA